MAVGRPSYITEQVIADICSYIEKGVPIKYACEANGIQYTTACLWQQTANKIRKAAAAGEPLEPGKYDDLYLAFLDAKEAAHAKFVATNSMVVLKHGVGYTTADGSVKPGDWRASAWLLERRGGTEFVERSQVDMQHSGQLGMEHSGTVTHRIEIPDDAERLREVANVLDEIRALPEPSPVLDVEASSSPPYDSGNGFHPQPPSDDD